MSIDTFPKVVVVVVNWNGRELLRVSLPSLLETTDYPNYNTVLVDNGSTDGSIEYSRTKFPEIDIVALDKNIGFADGNNRGIIYALRKYDPTYVLLLNNDTKIIQKDWLRQMASIANSNQGIAVIGPRLIDPNGAAQISAAYFTPYRTIFYRGNETRSVQWVSGACMMIRASALRRIGLLDERYNPMFFEETEYCFRCLNNGYEVMTVPGARVVHLRRRTRKRFSSSYGIYNWCKNEMLFFLTNLSWSYLPWLTLGDLKRMARKDLLAGAFRGHLIAALRGYRDGYRLSRQGNPTPSLGSLQFNAVDS